MVVHGDYRFLSASFTFLEAVPKWTYLVSVFAAGSIQLIERRKRSFPLHPGRQIAISTLIESMPEAVFVVDTTGRLIEANQGAERLLGLPRTTLLAMKDAELAHFIADHTVGESNSLQWAGTRALRGESVQERRTLKTGQQRSQISIGAKPIREQDGRIVGALVIAHDITELTQLQEHMADAERHDALGRMAASLAHDFNNVLDTISKAATVLEMMPDREPQDRAVLVRMIMNAVKRGSEIVNNVRQFLIGGQMQADQVDLNVVLEEAIQLTRPTWESQKNLSIIRMFHPVPRVRSNAAEMRRIFTNLILNSIDAMPSGGTLIVGCEEAKGKVQAFVEDTGVGISPDLRSHIFEPYYTTKNKGTGLGLSSALKIVQAQKGEITFTSKPGSGTRFTVELPALPKEPQRAA
ncbi:MAG TPA: ATP-binding protein [Terriglobales bacterium]|nr:ATP-binding protein [Terriglobales bacterium]